MAQLTVKGIEKLVREKAVGKHFDGGGLYLQITEAGGAYWRYKYRLAGKEKLYSFGTLADVTLAEVREKHHDARKLVAAGDHPVEVRQQVKVAKEAERADRLSFREVAQEWVNVMIPADAAVSAKWRANNAVERLGASFGAKDVKAVTVADLSSVLAKLDRDGKFATRERIQHAAIKIAGFAVGRGYLASNPFRDINFTDSFVSPGTVYEARPAITDIEPFGKLLRIIDRTPGEEEHCMIGLRLLNLLAVRPGELAKAKWADIDLAAAKMTVPPEVQKMRTLRKMKKDPRAGKAFDVPLSRQAIAELQKLHKLTGSHTHLFPAFSVRRYKNPHMRAAQFNNMLVRMGFQNEHCAHGFRSAFSTIMNAERVQVGDRKVVRWAYQDALIEVQLDHNDSSTKGVYDRGGHWEDRCEIMQVWADHVDEMRAARTQLKLVA